MKITCRTITLHIAGSDNDVSLFVQAIIDAKTKAKCEVVMERK